VDLEVTLPGFEGLLNFFYLQEMKGGGRAARASLRASFQLASQWQLTSFSYALLGFCLAAMVTKQICSYAHPHRFYAGVQI
jgi:hypothetical protein